MVGRGIIVAIFGLCEEPVAGDLTTSLKISPVIHATVRKLRALRVSVEWSSFPLIMLANSHGDGDGDGGGDDDGDGEVKKRQGRKDEVN